MKSPFWPRVSVWWLKIAWTHRDEISEEKPLLLWTNWPPPLLQNVQCRQQGWKKRGRDWREWDSFIMRKILSRFVTIWISHRMQQLEIFRSVLHSVRLLRISYSPFIHLNLLFSCLFAYFVPLLRPLFAALHQCNCSSRKTTALDSFWWSSNPESGRVECCYNEISWKLG